MKIKIFKFENVIYFLLIIFLAVHFKFFENTYIILKSNYDQRLTSNYGFCEKNSFGFIKYIDSKYALKKNIKIYNDEAYPLSDGFIYKPKKGYYNNKIILINYNENNSLIDLNKFEVLEKYKNCFYLKSK